MDGVVNRVKAKHKKSGLRVSLLIHLLIIILALLPLLTYPDPPPGQEGILVNLGLPDIGQGDDNAGPTQVEEQEEVEATPVEEVEEDVPEDPEPVKEKEVKKDPEPVKEKEIVKSEDPEAIALKKKKEREQQEKEKAAAAEREKKRKEKAAADAKAAEEARKASEAQKTKDEISGLFGDGGGKGNTGKEGNQGDPGGDPSSDNLEGISTGSGNVGGGLGGRGVASTYSPKDNSQTEGRVVIKLCVDRSGKVIPSSVEFTQGGSTVFDSHLKKISIDAAKRWRFQPGQVDKQCGTITFNFKSR